MSLFGGFTDESLAHWPAVNEIAHTFGIFFWRLHMKSCIAFACALTSAAAFAGQGAIMRPQIAGEVTIMRGGGCHVGAIVGTLAVFRVHSIAGSGHIDFSTEPDGKYSSTSKPWSDPTRESDLIASINRSPRARGFADWRMWL